MYINRNISTISKAIEQSIADTGSIHTADKELERIIANAIKKEELRHKKIKDELDDTKKMETYKCMVIS